MWPNKRLAPRLMSLACDRPSTGESTIPNTLAPYASRPDALAFSRVVKMNENGKIIFYFFLNRRLCSIHSACSLWRANHPTDSFFARLFLSAVTDLPPCLCLSCLVG